MTMIDHYDDYDEVTHTVDGLELGTPFGDATVGYRAECECGWQGEWRDCVTVARQDGQVHRDGAVPPGDLDELVTGLLDLQDDLAAVVMWLAENWSAHLPKLGWHSRSGSGDRDVPAVKVHGCGDLEGVAEAAGSLGVVPTDDPAPNTYGYCLRRAVRRFGRVEVEVFANLDETTGNRP
jgi:hypothetical protein